MNGEVSGLAVNSSLSKRTHVSRFGLEPCFPQSSPQTEHTVFTFLGDGFFICSSEEVVDGG